MKVEMFVRNLPEMGWWYQKPVTKSYKMCDLTILMTWYKKISFGGIETLSEKTTLLQTVLPFLLKGVSRGQILFSMSRFPFNRKILCPENTSVAEVKEGVSIVTMLEKSIEWIKYILKAIKNIQ